MWPIRFPETSVRNYHYSLRNNPEERSSHLLRGGTLKSRIKRACFFIAASPYCSCNLCFRMSTLEERWQVTGPIWINVPQVHRNSSFVCMTGLTWFVWVFHPSILRYFMVTPASPQPEGDTRGGVTKIMLRVFAVLWQKVKAKLRHIVYKFSSRL